MRAAGTGGLYAVDTRPLREVDQWARTFRQFWTNPLQALANRIARADASGARTTRPPRPRRQPVIDTTSQVNAIRRQLGTRVLEAGEARV